MTANNWSWKISIYITFTEKNEDASLNIAVINSLLDIITNAKLKLLLKSDIITCKTHNQFTTINLVFSSEKIQFMTRKCKICINLHQELNHLSIVTELCL